MKRLVLAFVLVGAIGGVAEARPPRSSPAQHRHPAGTSPAKVAVRPRRPSFIGFLVSELIWPGLKKGAEVAVAGAVVAAL